MGWQYTLFVLGIITSLFFTLRLSFYALSNRAIKGTKIFVWLMIAISETLFCDLLRWLSVDQHIQIICAKLSFLGSAVVPVAIFIFALNFAGRQQWLTRRHMVLLSVVPVATILLAWSNDFHHLIWTSIRFYKEGSLLLSDISYGFWFWIFQIYGNLLILLSLIFLIKETIHRPRLPMWVVGILILSLLMPWSGSIIYNLRLGPIPGLDLTPLTYAFSSLVIFAAILRYNVFGIAPIARTKLIDNMREGMIVLNTSNQVIDINPSVQRFFNLPPTKILGKPIEQLLPDWHKTLAKVLESSEAEVEITAGEGVDQRFYALRCSPIYIRAESNPGWLLILQDITDRKWLRLALQASEEQYRSVVERATDGIVIVQDGLIKYYNPQMAAMLGLSPTEALGIPFDRYCTPEEQVIVRDRHTRRMRGEPVPNPYNTALIKKDGGILYVEVNGTIMEYEDAPAVLAFFHDITDRLRTEKALQESEARYRSVVEDQTDLINRWLPDTTLTFVNDVWCRIFGGSPEEWVGKSYLNNTPEIDLPALQAHITEVLQLTPENSISTGEARGVLPNGEIHWFQWSERAIFDDQGRIIAIQGVGRDITERKQAEERIRQLNAELERNVVELKRSNAELQQFAYVASHDLQEPLRKVTAFGNLLQDKFIDIIGEEGKSYLQRMQSATHRMQTMILDLLTLSRVTTRGQPFMPTNLTQLAQEVLADLDIRLQETGGYIEIGDLPTIDADPTQIRQLLANLINNALKFHHQGVPPFVKVYAELTPGNGQNSICNLMVTDKGIGFEEKYLEQIFQPFQRLHGRSEYEGTGMGLAICRKIVERHRGSISAQSTPGKGSTFTVTLPVTQPL